MVRKHTRLFSWHHWCGLIAGIFLLIMSISGAILVFTQEIEKTYERPWLPVENHQAGVSYDASFFTVQNMYPDWEIRLSGVQEQGPDEAIVYDLRKAGEIRKVFAHPSTGSLLHVSDGVQSQLQRRLLTLHHTLFAGNTGKLIVFFTGILFFISLLTGIYLYRKALYKVLLFKFRINRRTTRGFYSSLHRMIGVWSLFFNLLIATTGLFISGSMLVTAFGPARLQKEKTGRVLYSVDRIQKTLQEHYPDFTIYFIRKAANSNIVQFSGKFGTDPFYYGKYNSRFSYDGATGSLLGSERLQYQGAWKKWQGIIHPLHFGNFSGLAVKFLYSFFGLMPGILSISGFIIWKKKTKVSRLRQAG